MDAASVSNRPTPDQSRQIRQRLASRYNSARPSPEVRFQNPLSTLQLTANCFGITNNHPSGEPEPSTADKRITERIKSALALVDIRVLDHIIVGDA